jgi:hypothetical protein
MSEYLSLAVKFSDGVAVLQKLSGIVDTDYGIGVVVEKLVGRDGGLAPNLATLGRTEGVTPCILEKIDQFQKELLHFGVIVGKLHDKNLVLAVRGDEERFVMVDGYGEKAAIPIGCNSFPKLYEQCPLGGPGRHVDAARQHAGCAWP